MSRLHFKPWHILMKTTELVTPFGTMSQEPWHPGNGAKLDCIIQLNYREVYTNASCITSRTWENLNNWGTKMILLSDTLWLIANNSKSFVNGNKSLIRNNLGLCKYPEIYPILNFQKHCHGSNNKKYRLDKKRYIKQNNDIQKWQKKNGGEIRPFLALLLGNDKTMLLLIKY